MNPCAIGQRRSRGVTARAQSRLLHMALRSVLVGLALVPLACSDVTNEPVDASAPDAMTGADAGAPDAQVASCPAPTNGPTMHGGDVRTAEVWRAADGPHVF